MAETGARRPRLLFVVAEDWYFCSHRLHIALAAKDAGFDVAVATRVGRHEDRIQAAGLRLHPIGLSRLSALVEAAGFSDPAPVFQALDFQGFLLQRLS